VLACRVSVPLIPNIRTPYSEYSHHLFRILIPLIIITRTPLSEDSYPLFRSLVPLIPKTRTPCSEYSYRLLLLLVPPYPYRIIRIRPHALSAEPSLRRSVGFDDVLESVERRLASLRVPHTRTHTRTHAHTHTHARARAHTQLRIHIHCAYAQPVGKSTREQDRIVLCASARGVRDRPQDAHFVREVRGARRGPAGAPLSTAEYH
jgi:hypothetical protein